MGKSHGLRSRTRSKFSRPFRKNGAINMKNYLETIKVGEHVDIIVNGAIHRGMPFNFYHGRTGRVFNVNKRGLGVIIKKKVRQRYMEKRLNILREHVRKSNCRSNFVERVKENDRIKTEANKKGERVSTKRKPAMAREREAMTLNVDDLLVHSMNPHLVIH